MSFFNRTIIPTANGLTTLSIPLVGGRETRALLRDVKIDNSQSWQVRHWRTITSAYRRSPWFEFYEPRLAPFFENQYEKLVDWNLDLFKWSLDVLKLKVELRLIAEETGDFPNMVSGLKPSNFQHEEFTRNLPQYPQVFQDRTGFEPNVSIIDLLFNEGNNSRSLIANAST